MMGRYMIPVCVMCGDAAPRFHDKDWEDAGGTQDLCPQHATELRKKYGLLYVWTGNDLCEGIRCELSTPTSK